MTPEASRSLGFLRDLSAAFEACRRGVDPRPWLTRFDDLLETDLGFLCDALKAHIGTGDQGIIRSKCLLTLGDTFRTARNGPIGHFRELSIAAYSNAIDLYPELREPYCKLAAVYQTRKMGGRAENARLTELYATRFMEMLQGAEYEQRGIALQLRGLARGSQVEQLEDSRRDFECALEQFEKHGRNVNWRSAEVHSNMGKVEADHSNYSLAERYYRRALHLYAAERGNSPEVSFAKRNLAATLIEWAKSVIEADKRHASELVEMAIALLESAQALTDQRGDPHSSAAIALNLGMAYAFRVGTLRTEYFLNAKREFLRSAELFHQLLDPVNERRAVASAAGISFELFDWVEAASQFRTSMDLLDDEWLQAHEAATRRKLMKDHAEIYGFGLLSAIKANDLREALQFLERGRTRLLRDTLYAIEVTCPAGVSEALWSSLRQIQKTRARTSFELVSFDFEYRRKRAESIDQHRREEREITAQIRTASPYFLPAAFPESPESIQKLAQELNAELWLIKPTRTAAILLVVSAEGELRWDIVENANRDELAKGLAAWLNSYQKFRNAENGEEITFYLPEWKRSWDVTLRWLREAILSRCLEMGKIDLEDQTRKQRIYVLAGGLLDFIPWHAIPLYDDRSRKRCLIDAADIAYFGSATLLRASLERQKRSRRHGGLQVVRDPLVSYGGWLADISKGLFASASCVRDLPGRGADLKRLIEGTPANDITLFCCHAKAHAQDALRSGFYLTACSEPCISLRDLLEIRTDHMRLVVLNSCESSLSEIGDPADECLSLANAFLATGAESVVGTQWCAAALPAALWCAYFLNQLQLVQSREGQQDALRASCLSSIWFRDASPEAIIEFVKKLPHGDLIDDTTIRQVDGSELFNWANHKFYGASLVHE